MQENFYRAVSTTHAMKNCGKDELIATVEVAREAQEYPDDCEQHFCHLQNCTNISHKLTFIAF
jgi:hypothetical protein